MRRQEHLPSYGCLKLHILQLSLGQHSPVPPKPNADLTPNKILRIKDKIAAPTLRKAEELILEKIIGCVFEKSMQNTVARLSLKQEGLILKQVP